MVVLVVFRLIESAWGLKIGPTTVSEGAYTRRWKCVLFFDLVVAVVLRKWQLKIKVPKDRCRLVLGNHF